MMSLLGGPPLNVLGSGRSLQDIRKEKKNEINWCSDLGRYKTNRKLDATVTFPLSPFAAMSNLQHSNATRRTPKRKASGCCEVVVEGVRTTERRMVDPFTAHSLPSLPSLPSLVVPHGYHEAWNHGRGEFKKHAASHDIVSVSLSILGASPDTHVVHLAFIPSPASSSSSCHHPLPKRARFTQVSHPF